jgi:heme/copper-type cytochrome/quinol oxidase subunit 4
MLSVIYCFASECMQQRRKTVARSLLLYRLTCFYLCYVILTFLNITVILNHHLKSKIMMMIIIIVIIIIIIITLLFGCLR